MFLKPSKRSETSRVLFVVHQSSLGFPGFLPRIGSGFYGQQCLFLPELHHSRHAQTFAQRCNDDVVVKECAPAMPSVRNLVQVAYMRDRAKFLEREMKGMLSQMTRNNVSELRLGNLLLSCVVVAVSATVLLVVGCGTMRSARRDYLIASFVSAVDTVAHPERICMSRN